MKVTGRAKRIKGLLTAFMVLCIVFGQMFLSTSFDVGAVTSNYTISISQVVYLAVSGSAKYKKVKSKIALQEVKYAQALKSIQLKKKNMLTFRWSPLLSFHFPESPELSDEYEWTYKPMQIQYQISKLNHELTDIKYSVKEEVSNLYVQAYTAQEKIAYYEEYIDNLQVTLEKNKAKYYVGTASKSDIDLIENQITSAQNSLMAVSRSFETIKRKLSNMINLDVTSGYDFVNPYIKAEIPRSKLEEIIAYTLENNQAYYEAKTDTQAALTALNTNYSLMRRHYGNDINMLSGYFSSVWNDKKVDSAGFKMAYDNFLNKIDSYWQGKKRILFIKISREWFKGAVDGARYIEDDPYILYTSALEYIDYWNEQENVKKEITVNVRDSFDNLVVVRNAYLTLAEQTVSLKMELQEAAIYNKLGKMSFEEYSDVQKLYQESQLDEMDALDLYTQTLNTFDRLTCGAVTNYLNGADISLSRTSGGMSFVEEGESSRIEYYIVSKIEDNMFELGISVPDDAGVEVTDFELWIDNVMVGQRTEAGKVIRHLALAMDAPDKAFIRLYNDGEFVADCELDVFETRGILKLPEGSLAKEELPDGPEIVGNLTYTKDASTGLITISIQPEVTKNISYYNITDYMGNPLISDELIDIKRDFKYLGFVADSLSTLVFRFYDRSGEYLFSGSLNEMDMTIIKEVQ